MTSVRRAWFCLLLAACPSHPKKPDAKVDSPPDSPPDSGPCPSARFFTGEYVDWDSTDSVFCGIYMGTFAISGGPSDHTNPNGRFQLCLAAAQPTRVDITPPTGASMCQPSPGSYAMPGLAMADPAVIATGEVVSMRDFTAERTATLGVTLDGAKGHVFVHVDKTAQPVTISSASDAAQAWSGTAWAAGNQGINVFFPNAAVGNTTVSMTGGAVGTGSVPVEAGKITYVTLVGN
jgi:hypothetical protein